MHVKKWIISHFIGLIITVVILFSTISLISSLNNRQDVICQPNDVALHTAADRFSKTTAKLAHGTQLTVLEKHAGWWRVRNHANGQTGWVASWVITNTDLATATPLSEATVVLDPGHGGSDTGALSTDGQHFEKDYTLATAKKVQTKLAKTGCRVIMTRHDDTLVPLLDISAIANDAKADAFVSLHFDSFTENNAASGISEYYSRQDNGSPELAACLQTQLEHAALPQRRIDTADYLVLKHNRQPAVLLELGYINTDDDFKQIQSDTYQNDVAQRIAAGITTYVTTQKAAP